MLHLKYSLREILFLEKAPKSFEGEIPIKNEF
jgi:hypothetical protein